MACLKVFWPCYGRVYFKIQSTSSGIVDWRSQPCVSVLKIWAPFGLAYSLVADFPVLLSVLQRTPKVTEYLCK